MLDKLNVLLKSYYLSSKLFDEIIVIEYIEDKGASAITDFVYLTIRIGNNDFTRRVILLTFYRNELIKVNGEIKLAEIELLNNILLEVVSDVK